MCKAMAVIRWAVVLLLTLTGTVMKVAAQLPIQPLWSLAGGASPEPLLEAVDADNDRIYWMKGSLYGEDVLVSVGSDGTVISSVGWPPFIGPLDLWPNPIYQEMKAWRDTVQLRLKVELWDHVYQWAAIFPQNGGRPRLFGGREHHRDAEHTPFGWLFAVGDSVRRLDRAGWPAGSAAVPGADNLVVFPDRVVLGTPPDLSALRLPGLEPLPSIPAPAAGVPTTTRLIGSEGHVHYATLSAGPVLHVGAVDTSGVVLWQQTLPLLGDHLLTDLEVDNFGGTWVSLTRRAGFTPVEGVLVGIADGGAPVSYLNYGVSIAEVEALGDTLILTGRMGPSDTYLIAYHAGIITGTSVPAAEALRVYPDPAVDRLWITGSSPQAERVRILDAHGRTVLQQPTGGDVDVEVGVEGLAPGLYTVLTEGPGIRLAQRFVRGR